MASGKIMEGICSYIDYLNDKKKVATSTLSAYNTDLNNFENYLNQKYSLTHINEINQGIIMSYVLFMKNEGRASSTISRSLSAIKNFMLYCYHEKMIDDNLSDFKYDLPKEEKKLPEVLTVDEVNLILSQPPNTDLGRRDKAMLEVLYSSGLKVNELIDLRLEDVDMKLKVLKCSGKKRQRILPLGAMAYEAMVAYLERSRVNLCKKPSEILFLSYSGEQMTRQGFWKLIKKYVKAAGIDKKISTSTFRHSFATHMIENGIHKETLKEALGNASVASVQMYLDLNRKRTNSL